MAPAPLTPQTTPSGIKPWMASVKRINTKAWPNFSSGASSEDQPLQPSPTKPDALSKNEVQGVPEHIRTTEGKLQRSKNDSLEHVRRTEDELQCVKREARWHQRHLEQLTARISDEERRRLYTRYSSVGVQCDLDAHAGKPVAPLPKVWRQETCFDHTPPSTANGLGVPQDNDRDGQQLEPFPAFDSAEDPYTPGRYTAPEPEAERAALIADRNTAKSGYVHTKVLKTASFTRAERVEELRLFLAHLLQMDYATTPPWHRGRSLDSDSGCDFAPAEDILLDFTAPALDVRKRWAINRVYASSPSAYRQHLVDVVLRPAETLGIPADVVLQMAHSFQQNSYFWYFYRGCLNGLARCHGMQHLALKLHIDRAVVIPAITRERPALRAELTDANDRAQARYFTHLERTRAILSPEGMDIQKNACYGLSKALSKVMGRGPVNSTVSGAVAGVNRRLRKLRGDDAVGQENVLLCLRHVDDERKKEFDMEGWKEWEEYKA